jgi:cytochrome c oxidase subunit 2
MLADGITILVLVLVVTLLALAGRGRARRAVASERTILLAGLWLPVAVLSALLVYGFGLLEQAAADGESDLEIEVTAEQWWWRVVYRHEDGSSTETANELRIPVGRSVRLELHSADVIHSFWVPALAGKRDMIPGRVNELALAAGVPGTYRGQCAEYCGGAHALMSFYVVAEPTAAFNAWLERERADASAADPTGAELFAAAGCGGCHAIRGTESSGEIGPDLTHVGGRLSIGAGTLGTSASGFTEWLRSHQLLKPSNRMPPFEALTAGDSARLAAFLETLD